MNEKEKLFKMLNSPNEDIRKYARDYFLDNELYNQLDMIGAGLFYYSMGMKQEDRNFFEKCPYYNFKINGSISALIYYSYARQFYRDDFIADYEALYNSIKNKLAEIM